MYRNLFTIISRLLVISILALCLGSEGAAYAADVVIIVNRGVSADTVKKSDIKQVFLGTQKQLSDGTRAKPAILEEGPVHKAFLKQYVGKSGQAFRTHLRKLVFTGKGSLPKTFQSESDLVAYVAKTANAVGYVSNGSASGSVKVLTVK